MSALVLLLLAQSFGDPLGPVYSDPSRRVSASSSLAYFELAPSSGLGMTAACACSAITGAAGEAVTFSRSSAAYCAKEGLATTGITNTSMVLCATNQIRVEADGSGVLGLRVESARTNTLLHSQDFTNAVWQAVVGGTSSPVVTANYAVAPDGTTTAERIEFPACAAGDSYSLIQQDYTGTAAAWSGAVYLKGTSGSGTVSVYYYDNVAGAGTGAQCAFNATTWSRCEVRRAWANTAHRFGFGCNNLSVITNFSNTGAADVLVWQGDSQLGAFITSPIPTTTAAVTRALETATVSGSAFPAAPFSLFASYTPAYASGLGVSAGIFEGQIGSASGAGLFFNAGFFRFQTLNAGAQNVQNTPTLVPSTAYRLGGVNESGNSTLYFGGSIVAGPTAKNNTAAPWATATGVGYSPANPFYAEGIVSRICLDPSPTRCR